jgi:hypothetical protein
MFNPIKNILLFLFIINLTACSYSPDSLKELYAEIAPEFADEIKKGINTTPQQSAMIDDYTKQLMQWHRRNKLPEYSRLFANLASLVEQDNIPVTQLNTVLNQLDAMPHFEQATHLTHKMIAVAESLSSQQISKIEHITNNEYRQDVLESKQESYSQETVDDIKIMFSFLGINLNAHQRQSIKIKVKKLHDIRPYELQAEKRWNKQFISTLRQSNNPNFAARFKQSWDIKEQLLTGKAYQLEQQNNLLMTNLIKELISSFTPEEKNKLSRQLMSISHTLGEMVYE